MTVQLFNHTYQRGMTIQEEDLQMCLDIEEYVSEQWVWPYILCLLSKRPQALRNNAKAKPQLPCAEKRKSTQEGPSDRCKQRRCESKSSLNDGEPAVLPAHKKAKFTASPDFGEVQVDESAIIADGYPTQIGLPEDNGNTATYDIPIPDMYHPSDEMAMTLLEDHVRLTRKKANKPTFQIHEDAEVAHSDDEDPEDELDEIVEFDEPWWPEDNKENEEYEYYMMTEMDMGASQEMIIDAAIANRDGEEQEVRTEIPEDSQAMQADAAIPRARYPSYLGSPLRELHIPGSSDF